MTRHKSSLKAKSERLGENQRDAVEVQPRMQISKPTSGVDGAARSLGVRHAVLYVSVLCVYIYTALPSVPGGDSGELLAEACHWGIPHPPGYPLLNVFHNAVSNFVRSDIIPVAWPNSPDIGQIGATSKVAFSANILAGIFGAGAAVIVCLAVEEWTHGSKEAYNPGAAAGVALLFSFSPLVWEHSTGTEVFALNNLLVATALYLTARSIRRPSMNAARVGATVCGLALSNQHASFLMLVPLAFSVILALNRVLLLTWRSAAELGGLWLPLGLSPYVALAMSARRPQQGSWGDLSSFWGFARHFLRIEYGTFRLGIATGNIEGTLDRLRLYLGDSSLQTMHLGPPLALLGIGWALEVSRRSQSPKRVGAYAIGLVSAWLSYVIIWHGVLSNISLRSPMSRAVHARFWMQPNLVLCLAAGGGLGVITNAATVICRRGLSTFCRLNIRTVEAAVSILLPTAMAAALISLRWNTVNRGVWSGKSHGWTMHLYGQVSDDVALLANIYDRTQQSVLRLV